MKQAWILLFTILFSTFHFIHVSAQTTPNATVSIDDITSAGISLVIFPETPGPNQTVTASIESSSADLDISTITWKKNGQKVAGGLGVTTYSFQNGALGSKTTLSVSIDTAGTIITKSIDLSPGDVDLLWQGRGYTPPFYEGRTLWATEGQVIFTAIPHILSSNGQELNRSDLVYRWSKDGTVLGSASGAGKNSITLTDSVLSMPSTIKVDIMTDRDTVVASRSANLSPRTPEVLIYENSPLYGILMGRDIGDTFSTKDQEFSFSAIPLFFSGSSKDAPSLNYAWQTNANNTQSGSKVTYRTPDGTTGSSQIDLRINNTSKVVQSAERNFLVQFGNQINL